MKIFEKKEGTWRDFDILYYGQRRRLLRFLPGADVPIPGLVSVIPGAEVTEQCAVTPSLPWSPFILPLEVRGVRLSLSGVILASFHGRTDK